MVLETLWIFIFTAKLLKSYVLNLLQTLNQYMNDNKDYNEYNYLWNYFMVYVRSFDLIFEFVYIFCQTIITLKEVGSR